ncbi:hypothetical protein CPC197_0841B, partial [Chlamydia psittaci C1/97]
LPQQTARFLNPHGQS